MVNLCALPMLGQCVLMKLWRTAVPVTSIWPLFFGAQKASPGIWQECHKHTFSTTNLPLEMQMFITILALLRPLLPLGFMRYVLRGKVSPPKMMYGMSMSSYCSGMSSRMFLGLSSIQFFNSDSPYNCQSGELVPCVSPDKSVVCIHQGCQDNRGETHLVAVYTPRL